MPEKKKGRTLAKNTCDWSGEESSGLMYVLQTTQGPQLVAEETFRGERVPARTLRTTQIKVERLEARVDELEKAVNDLLAAAKEGKSS